MGKSSHMHQNQEVPEYGPYTPQELEKVVQWLQNNQIQFEILRNDQDEKEALMNDARNVVVLAEMRLNVYLAQIYYVKIQSISDVLLGQFQEKFLVQNEGYGASRSPQRQGTVPVNLNEFEDAELLSRHKAQHKMKKAFWAWLAIALFILIPIINALYRFLRSQNV